MSYDVIIRGGTVSRVSLNDVRGAGRSGNLGTDDLSPQRVGDVDR
jgi:hypothetical protein